MFYDIYKMHPKDVIEYIAGCLVKFGPETYTRDLVARLETQFTKTRNYTVEDQMMERFTFALKEEFCEQQGLKNETDTYPHPR